MPFKNILVCVDFTDISDAVVNSAALLSKIFDAKINLLTVIERPVPILHEGFEELIEPEEIEILFELEKKLREEAEERLNKYAKNLSDKNIKVKTIIEISENITDTILDNIEKEKVDLVIIGSHKKGLVDKLLLGSISEKIVNKSPVSTLIIKGKEIKDLKRLLVGYDFLPNSKEALNIAQEIAKKCNSDIFIVHADTDIKHTHI
ncbi:MAG: universal stress protein, partial [Aquificota bacterium]